MLVDRLYSITRLKFPFATITELLLSNTEWVIDILTGASTPLSSPALWQHSPASSPQTILSTLWPFVNSLQPPALRQQCQQAIPLTAIALLHPLGGTLHLLSIVQYSPSCRHFATLPIPHSFSRPLSVPSSLKKHYQLQPSSATLTLPPLGSPSPPSHPWAALSTLPPLGSTVDTGLSQQALPALITIYTSPNSTPY